MVLKQCYFENFLGGNTILFDGSNECLVSLSQLLQKLEDPATNPIEIPDYRL
jgi:hypothetical protein